jgi:hypothetical protein
VRTISTDCRRRRLKHGEAWGLTDEALAVDGKTMKGAIDEAGRQTHIMSVVGHESEHCYTQRKSAPCR